MFSPFESQPPDQDASISLLPLGLDGKDQRAHVEQAVMGDSSTLTRLVLSKLEEQIERVSPCDLLLVEGHKRHPLPKLEVWRRENGKPLLYPEDGHIVAIASDTPLETRLPRFDLNDHEGIGNFILSYNGF